MDLTPYVCYFAIWSVIFTVWFQWPIPGESWRHRSKQDRVVSFVYGLGLAFVLAIFAYVIIYATTLWWGQNGTCA